MIYNNNIKIGGESEMVFKRSSRQTKELERTLVNIKHELRSLSEASGLPNNTLYSAVYQTILKTLEANKK